MTVYFPENGQAPLLFLLHPEASLLLVAAGFAFALLEQQLFAAPAAAGFAFALLEQQLFVAPAAAGFTFASVFAALAAASGHCGVPRSGQFAAALLHFVGSQFDRSQLDPTHRVATAAALTFSVLLQPIVAKPSKATSVRVSSCFIEFSIIGFRGRGEPLIVVVLKVQIKTIFR